MGVLDFFAREFARGIMNGLRGISDFEQYVAEGLDCLGLAPDRQSEKSILLNAHIADSRNFPLVCLSHWPLVDVFVLSGLDFPLNEVPGPISYALLRRNHQLPIGAWRLIASDNESSVACGHVIDSRCHSAPYLAWTVEQLFAETERLRRLIG